MAGVKGEVEKAFQTTFRIIFGECNVKMDELKDYLLRDGYPLEKRKSSVSGKDVYLSEWRYCPGAKIISQDEENMGPGRKFAPLDMNEAKDIDSIIGAVQDRLYYEGSKKFGTTDFAEESDTVTSSFHVYNSHHLLNSRYAGYSSYLRDESEYVFGSGYFLRTKYAIKVIAADKVTRSFETYISANCADAFYCYDCVGCNHVMFSFNLRTKNYAIGNLELPKDKYFAMRKKLVDESREYIEKHRDFPSMFESLPKLKTKPEISVKRRPAPALDIKPVDEAWRSACKVVLGKDIGPLGKYGGFLSERVNAVRKIKTIFGNETYCSDIFFYKHLPGERIVNMDEAEEIAKMHLTFEDGEEVSLKSVLGKISPIAFFRAEFAEGSNANNMETQIPYTATNTYRVVDATYAKNCAYDTFALNSEYIFGSYRAIYSKFCIRCHSNFNLSSCFEMDNCTNSANSMYCHNVEGVDSSMFCFNTKSKRHAIGNVEVGRENYLKVKKIVLDEITQKLEKDARFPLTYSPWAATSP